MKCAILVGFAVILAAGGRDRLTWAQPADAPAPRAVGPGEAPSPESMRELLTRRAERANRERAALREALDMLNQGRPTVEVREFLRDKIGDEMRERAEQWRDRRDRPGEGRRPAEPRGRGGEGPDGDPMFAPGPGDGPRAPRGEERPPADAPPLHPDRTLELLRDVNPPMFERLRRLRERNPEEFREAVRRVGPRLAEFDRESRAHPDMWRLRVQMFRLERDARDLARQVAAGGVEPDEDATARLRRMVGEQFDLRLRMRDQEIQDLTDRVARIRTQMETARVDREELVATRTRELVQQARRGDRPPPNKEDPAPNRRRNPPKGGPSPQEGPRPQD